MNTTIYQPEAISSIYRPFAKYGAHKASSFASKSAKQAVQGSCKGFPAARVLGN